MTVVKITFQLVPKSGQFEYVSSNLKRIKGLELVLGERDSQGDIICTSTVPDDHSERTANLCGDMCTIEGVDRIKIFVTIESEPQSIAQRIIPLVPMITSSAVTFFIIFSVIDALGKDTNAWDVFRFAGVPTIVAFLSQFAYLPLQTWIKSLKK